MLKVSQQLTVQLLLLKRWSIAFLSVYLHIFHSFFASFFFALFYFILIYKNFSFLIFCVWWFRLVLVVDSFETLLPLYSANCWVLLAFRCSFFGILSVIFFLVFCFLLWRFRFVFLHPPAAAWSLFISCSPPLHTLRHLFECVKFSYLDSFFLLFLSFFLGLANGDLAVAISESPLFLFPIFWQLW